MMGVVVIVVHSGGAHGADDARRDTVSSDYAMEEYIEHLCGGRRALSCYQLDSSRESICHDQDMVVSIDRFV